MVDVLTDRRKEPAVGLDPLDYQTLYTARRSHPAWKLLSADHAPLVIGFCVAVFLEPNIRSLAGPQVVDLLDEYLSALRQIDPDAFPKRAEAYLADWSRPETGWLRRHYRPGEDVPSYEPTPAVELAASFCRDLGPKEFVGTASRLLTVRDLLRQIAAGAADDPKDRLAALHRQRVEIDDAIAAIHDGVGQTMDATAVRERHAQVAATARALLSDLRSVEERMRDLDRSVRAKVTSWDGPRGELLDEVFGSRSSINDSDQGRSWQAFWEFLLSSRAQDELDSLLAQIRILPALAGRTGEVENLLRSDLFHAAETTQRTVASLSAQLRRFLDDQHWAEQRRVAELIRQTLTTALEIADSDQTVNGMGGVLEDLRAHVALPLERPLYVEPLRGELDAEEAVEGGGDIDLSELFDAGELDMTRLYDAVADAVTRHGAGVSLGQVVADHPLQEGLAELVGYLGVSDTDGLVTSGREQVAWTDAAGTDRVAELPLIVFDPGRPRSQPELAGSLPPRDGQGSGHDRPVTPVPPLRSDPREDHEIV